MRSAIIKKARQDEQQNLKTTANINYIQNFMSIKKNLTRKSRGRQIKIKLNKITCTLLEKHGTSP